MPNPTFEEVLEAAKTLNPAEQRRLRDLLDAWVATPPLDPTKIPTEEEFEQELLREGFLDHVPPPITDFSAWEDWEPIEIEGPPLSETIIEDRR